MIKRHYIVLIAALIGLCFLAGCSKEEKTHEQQKTVLNQLAPVFSLLDSEGKEWNLESFRGKVVFVNFWATWCPPCREEMPSMLKLKAMMEGKPFVMLTILMNDDPVKAKNFLQKLGGSLPVLQDPGGKLAEIYGLTGVPETFIIDKQGILRKKYIGAWPWDSDGALEMLKVFL